MKKALIITVLLAAVAGCATGGGVARTVRYPNAVTPEIQTRFDEAENLYRAKRLSEADAMFAAMIADLPYTEITDESRFRRGEIAFLEKNYAAALEHYRQAFSQIASPHVAPKAHFKAAMSLMKLSRPQEALEEARQVDRRDASPVLRIRTDALGVRAAAAAGVTPNAAIVWSLFLLDDFAESQGTAPAGIPPDELASEPTALLEVRRWVSDASVTAAEVEALPLKAMRGKRSGGFATYKLALAMQAAGETGAATRQLRSYLSTYPKHEFYGAARSLLGEMGGAIGEGAGITVGVILPMSGRYAVYGESALHGIECAIGVYAPCVGPSGIKLVIRDSEAMAGGVAAAVDELAAENVIAIIGPLLSTTVMEAANRAQELGVPMISLSQRSGVAEAGDFIFQNSVSDSSEVSTLADYAVNRLGLKRFFVVYPPNKKGSEYRGLFTEAVASVGGNVVGSQTFVPMHVSQPGQVDELRGRYMTEQQQVQMSEGGGARTAEPMLDFSVAPGGFDAVFIPDSLEVASYVAQRMSLGSRGRTQLLGVSRWDNQPLVDRAGSAVNGAVFVDSFYKGAPEQHMANFVSQFQQAYGIEPTMLEALGYDAMRLVTSALQEKGAKRRETVRMAIERTSNFPGVTGKITFDEQGRAKRELWVLRINDGRIEPAK